MDIGRQLRQIYDLLRARYGHQHWWPGDSPFEIVIGAILTQRTAWRNVEIAIGNLKGERLLSPRSIVAASSQDLIDAIKPAGFYNQKAVRLKAISEYLLKRCDGDFERMEEFATNQLRSELLEINGIGPETADSILLYALNRPRFVIDVYTRRALERIGIVSREMDYAELQSMFMERLTPEVDLYQDFHAQWVALGKSNCHPKPDCNSCPLNEICDFGLEANNNRM